jgi:hypothetical protein
MVMLRGNKTFKVNQKERKFSHSNVCVCDKAGWKDAKLAYLLFLCLFLFRVSS